ncbi:hypothetical protein [Streptomyces sp. NPDC059651]|uniref:phage tail protein n=1 Tax=Streptomyces sp. NPDC059651 TaxID=3346897 RepID=UPI0036B84859
MAVVIGSLVGLIRADDSGMRRGLTDAELRMRGFQRDTEGRLRDLRGRFARFGEDAGGHLAIAGRDGRSFSGVLGKIGGMAGSLGKVGLSIGTVAAKLGAAAPAAAGLVATLLQIAPAAAVGVSALLAVQLASAALKIGMVGVGDAVTAALDPSKPEAFNEALKKLSPNAKAFALEVKALAPEFKKLQQDVQDQLFKGLDTTLKGMAKNTLPAVRTALIDSAGALNLMGQGVGKAAIALGKEGTLGRALNGSTAGLKNLSRIPGELVTGLVQIGAAAAPAFSRLTASAGGAFDKLAAKVTQAFESGGMELAINTAIDLIGQLAKVAANIGKVLMSVFKAADSGGGGFLVTLQEITGAMATAFASPEVQAGLKALFQAMGTIAKTVAPLLGMAVKALAPVFEALGPPVETLIKALAAGLKPIIKALGPVLEAAAKAVGALVTAFAPLLTVAGQLIAAVLPVLTPLFDALATVFRALAPVIKDVGQILLDTLTPVLTGLSTVIKPLADMLAMQLVFWIQILGETVKALGPSLVTLGESLGNLLVALAPLIDAWAQLSAILLTALMPVLKPVIELIGKIATYFASDLADAINNVAVPAIKSITALLNGDFSEAQKYAKEAVMGFVDNAIRRFTELPTKAAEALASLVPKVRIKVNEAGVAMSEAIVRKREDLLEKFRNMPGMIVRALGSLKTLLYSAGAHVISGLISGIQSKVSSLASTLGGITNMIPSWKGPAPVDAKLLTPAGVSVMAGFQRGIASQVPGLRRQLQGITGEVPGMAMGSMGAAGAGSAASGPQRVVVEFAGPEAVLKLIRGTTRVNGRGSVQVAFGQAGR